MQEPAYVTAILKVFRGWGPGRGAFFKKTLSSGISPSAIPLSRITLAGYSSLARQMSRKLFTPMKNSRIMITQ